MASVWRTTIDEPLTAFAIIGGLLFVINGFRGEKQAAETIEVRPATIRALEQAQQDLRGRPLNETERQEVVDGFIDDEVLIREAFRLELERKDSRVRKRLLDVMRSTLDQPVATPTRAELEAYFRENRDRFEVDRLITFDHVFFNFGSEKVPADRGRLLESLRAGAEHAELGDYTSFGSVFRERSERELRRLFGPDFSRQAFALPMNQWQGPIESLSGIHFLRVTEKRKPPPPEFEPLEEYLRQDLIFQRRRSALNERIAELKTRYRIVFPDE